MAACGRSDEDQMVEMKEKVELVSWGSWPNFPHDMDSYKPSNFLKEIGRPRFFYKFMFSLKEF